MNHTIPVLKPTIATYFNASNRDELAQLASCFAADAVVVDENHTYRGSNEIRDWINKTHEHFVFKAEPTAVEERSGEFLVTGLIAGNFPGSPVELHYNFRLIDDRIASLTIVE